MRNIGLVVTTNIKNTLNSKVVSIIWYCMALFLVIAMTALFGVLLIAPELKAAAPDKTKLELYQGVIMFTASLLGLGINLNAIGFTSMIKYSCIYTGPDPGRGSNSFGPLYCKLYLFRPDCRFLV